MCQLFRHILFSSTAKSAKFWKFTNMPKPLYKTTRSRRQNAKTEKPKAKFSLPLANSKVDVLASPIKSESDEKLYRVIRLENGLHALLISDTHSLKTDLSSKETTTTDSDLSGSESSGSEGEEEEDEESGEGEGGSDGEENGVSEDEEGRRRVAWGREEADEKMAACALCIGVGSFSDPPHVQGLAHFVEHMVFMGSTKYPQENDFDSYIKKKGGSDNAATDCETTTFYFEIPEEHLAEAMDKFANFFISPLMKQETMQREREAVNSEFSLNLQSNSNRREQLLCGFLPEGHPCRTFMWGDDRSLSAPMGPQDADLHSEAHNFWKRHYSAHRITLAVQARLPLDTLEKYVTGIFGQMPTNNESPDDFSKYNFTKETVTSDFHAFYHVKPVGNKNELNISWCMKSLMSEYKSKPHQYVSWILGHEGEGSLLSYLRKKVWALGMYAGNSESGIDHTSLNCYFTLTIVLTKEGFLNIDKVIDSMFSYINMLRKECPNERIYKEIKDMEEISFRFEKEMDPCDNVEDLAENMHIYPPEHYITGGDLYYQYNPELITYVLDCMRPESVNIMLMSQEHDPPLQYTETEFWFGTKYIREDIPQHRVDTWNSIEPFKDFHLPLPNIFIPDDFSLIEKPLELTEAVAVLEKYRKKDLEETMDMVDGKITCSRNTNRKNQTRASRNRTKGRGKRSAKEVGSGEMLTSDQLERREACEVVKRYHESYPTKIRDDALMEVWYKPDYKFGLPNAIICVHMMPREPEDLARFWCMGDLWCRILSQYLKEKLYPSTMADFSYSITPGDRGFVLKFSGFSQKLPVLVDVVSKALSEYSSHLSDELFNALKDQEYKNHLNTLLKPSKLAKIVRFSLMIHKEASAIDRLSALPHVECDHVRQFFREMCEGGLRLRVLVQGNMSRGQVEGVVGVLEGNIRWGGLPQHLTPKIQVIELPPGKTYCRVASLNPQSSNSHTTNYYQWGSSLPLRLSCTLDLLLLMMEEPVFDQLRTKEQLGYSVFSMPRYTFGVLGYSVTVNSQANKHSTDHVDERIQAFSEFFKEEIANMRERAFEQTKAALIKQKMCVDVTLKDEVTRNWYEITSLEYMFDRVQREVECIKQITLDDVRQCFEDFSYTKGNDKFRMLSVQIVGNPAPDESGEEAMDPHLRQVSLEYLTDEDQAKTFVCDPVKFKEKLNVFPEYVPALQPQ